MKNIIRKDLPIIASITIGTRFWEQELSFEKYSKDLVSIFSTQSGEPIGDHTKSLFFGTVPIKNMIEETSRLLLNDYPKITGFSFSVLLKNISEKNGQLIQSCMCEKDEGGLVPGMFFVNLNNEDFNSFYNYSNNLFDDKIIQYIELLSSFPIDDVSEEYYSIDNEEYLDKKHKYIMDTNNGKFHIETLLDIAKGLSNIQKQEIKSQNLIDIEYKKEIFLETFGDLEKLKDLDIVIKYYKKRNWKIPAGKLMYISKIHSNIQSFGHILFLLESWLYVKKFPTVPSEWQLKNYNGDGNNYFLKSLLKGKEHDIVDMLKKSDTEISKMIFSKLFNLGEKELNRRKLERYENIHRFHFGWRKQLYLDDLKNNEFPL